MYCRKLPALVAHRVRCTLPCVPSGRRVQTGGNVATALPFFLAMMLLHSWRAVINRLSEIPTWAIFIGKVLTK